ncbi:MAG: hypothetical protein ACI9HK_001813, partial [Pirellulaceae bacterium]
GVGVALADDGVGVALADDGVEEAGEALRYSNYPWYDSESDSLDRIDVDPVDEPYSNRESDWLAAKTNPAPPRRGTRTMPSIGWATRLFQIFVYGGLILLATALLALLIWAVLRNGKTTWETQYEDVYESDEARVESLPFQVRKPHANLLEEANRLYQAGKYGEAIVYYYSYLLVELDKSHVIRLTKGKTNRQYLWEAEQRPELSRILESTMIRFEDVFFGDHELHREQFESCWEHRNEFQQQLERASTT